MEIDERIHLLTRQLTTHFGRESQTEDLSIRFLVDIEKPRPRLPISWVTDNQVIDDSWRRLKYANLVSKLQGYPQVKSAGNVLYLIQLLSGGETMEHLASNLNDFRMREEQAFGDYIEPPINRLYEADEALEAFGSFLRILHEDQNPSDDIILQELPYTFQGLKNDVFEWVEQLSSNKDKTWKDIAITIPPVIPFPLIGLLHKILEPALLYRQLWHCTTTNTRYGTSDKALLTQALHSAIQKELQSYLALIGVIENEVRRSAVSMSTTGKMTFTIRRVYTLLLDATLGLRLMHTIVMDCQSLIGGQILSLLHGYTYSGNDFVSRFASRLLRKVSKPFYEIMDRWLTSGTLADPYREFFVELGDESSEWKGRFVFNQTKVPSYMGNKIANTVFETGKSLYFIRVACGDRDWIDERKNRKVDIASAEEDYDKLAVQLQQGYDEVVNRLNELLKNTFHIDLHLQALKDYLLLTRGDFVQLLLEEAAPILGLPSVQLLRHHLTSMLETAIRGSNAINDSDIVLACLDARMLEMGHGDIGWDLFTLDYILSSPLDVVILDQWSNRQYLKVFNFLWRLKRVVYSLYDSWKVMNLDAKWRRCNHGALHDEEWIISSRRACQLMMHFLSELQYYITFEVIEMAWAKFQERLGLAGTNAGNSKKKRLTVDEIMEAHSDFLKTIAHKGLLGGEEGFMGHLHEILKKALLFTDSVKEMHRLMKRSSGHAERNARLEKIHDTQVALDASFERKVTALVSKLQTETDNEMRFLAVRLDFNGYYSNKIREYADSSSTTS